MPFFGSINIKYGIHKPAILDQALFVLFSILNSPTGVAIPGLPVEINVSLIIISFSYKRIFCSDKSISIFFTFTTSSFSGKPSIQVCPSLKGKTFITSKKSSVLYLFSFISLAKTGASITSAKQNKITILMVFNPFLLINYLFTLTIAIIQLNHSHLRYLAESASASIWSEKMKIKRE